MSKSGTPTSAVIEWGPTHSVVLNLASRDKRSSPEMFDAVQVLNGQRDVVAAVSRRTAFVRAIRVPNTAKAEVAQILRLQLAGLFPIPESELAYDFRLTDDVTAEGRLAVVGAMRETDLLKLHSEAKASGLKIKRVLPAAFGSMLVAKELGYPTCAVVQPTAEGIAIDIIAEGELRYTRLTPAADPETIEAEVLRTFAAAGVDPGPTVTTEGLHLPRATDSRTTTLEALGAPGAESLNLNLEPAEVTLARERSRQTARIRAAALMCLAAFLLALTVWLNRNDQQAAVDKVDAKEKRDLTERRKIRDGLIKKKTTALTLQRAIHQAFQPAQQISDILTLIVNDAPPGIWLTGIAVERGKVVTLRGTSLTSQAVADYETNLTNEGSAQKNPRFRDVKLVFANNGTVETKNVIEFAISLFPVGNLPVSQPATKGTK